MAMNVTDLCRLCAKKVFDDFSKDLLDESNRNVLKLIQDFVQIMVSSILYNNRIYKHKPQSHNKNIIFPSL